MLIFPYEFTGKLQDQNLTPRQKWNVGVPFSFTHFLHQKRKSFQQPGKTIFFKTQLPIDIFGVWK
jgi:hypothetical protein